MDDAEFDRSLIASAFGLAGERGWDAVSVAEAARRGGLALAQARERFPSRAAILIKFGRMADQGALADPPKEGTVRDRLFYLLMQRIDALQANRPGMLALLRALPSHPKTTVLLGCATRRSMRWMLDAAGVSVRGLRGELRVRGLVAVWLWTIRAWQGDETTDLSQTMAALDVALSRAEQFGGWFGGGSRAEPAAEAPGTEEISPGEIAPGKIAPGEIAQGEPPEPESQPPPDTPSQTPPSGPAPPMPPTSLPPEPLA